MKSLFIAVAIAVVMMAATQSIKANPLVFVASLSGPAESPPNASPGTGFTTVTIDSMSHTMRVQVAFSGLLAGTTASHIHAPTPAPFTGTAAVATTLPTFPGFPLGVTSGTYDMTFDMTLASSYNPAFVAANGGNTTDAEAALFSFIIAGRSYLNIHSTMFPGGEIRGFLAPVPEPATMLLLGTGLTSVALAIRRRRKVA